MYAGTPALFYRQPRSPPSHLHLPGELYLVESGLKQDLPILTIGEVSHAERSVLGPLKSTAAAQRLAREYFPALGSECLLRKPRIWPLALDIKSDS